LLAPPFLTPPGAQLALLDQGNRGVVCDGNLHVWDVETNKTIANLKRSSHVYRVSNATRGDDTEKLNWFGNMDKVVVDESGGHSGGGGLGWGAATVFNQSL
jgi:hypothetical protein